MQSHRRRRRPRLRSRHRRRCRASRTKSKSQNVNHRCLLKPRLVRRVGLTVCPCRQFELKASGRRRGSRARLRRRVKSALRALRSAALSARRRRHRRLACPRSTHPALPIGQARRAPLPRTQHQTHSRSTLRRRPPIYSRLLLMLTRAPRSRHLRSRAVAAAEGAMPKRLSASEKRNVDGAKGRKRRRRERAWLLQCPAVRLAARARRHRLVSTMMALPPRRRTVVVAASVREVTRGSRTARRPPPRRLNPCLPTHQPPRWQRQVPQRPRSRLYRPVRTVAVMGVEVSTVVVTRPSRARASRR